MCSAWHADADGGSPSTGSRWKSATDSGRMRGRLVEEYGIDPEPLCSAGPADAVGHCLRARQLQAADERLAASKRLLAAPGHAYNLLAPGEISTGVGNPS